jgi:hypothetical protein
LEDYLAQQKMTEPGLTIPAFVVDAVQYIIRHGLGATGLFRESGSQANMKRIKDNLDKGELLSAQELGDVNDVAGALKLYVRELPEALCTFKLFAPFCDTLKIADAALRLDEVRSLLQQLPTANHMVLETLCSMLYIVSRNHSLNKMHVSNLALVFGPNLLFSDPAASSGAAPDLMRMQIDSANVIGVVSHLVEHCEELFEERGSSKTSALTLHARLIGHTQRISLLAQTADLSLVWTIDTDNLLRFTSASTLLFEGQLQLPNRVFDVVMHGPLALLATSVGVEARDAQTGGFVQLLGGAAEPADAPPSPPHAVTHVLVLGAHLWAARHAPAGSGEATLLLDVYDTATWKRFHTVPIKDAPADAACVSHLFSSGGRVWVCLSDSSVRIVDPLTSAVQKVAGRGSPVVASARSAAALWTAHGDGAVGIWDQNQAQITRQLAHIGDSDSGTVAKLTQFGSCVLGTVRDCVVAWDFNSEKRLMHAHGYANGKNTTIVPVYNVARRRYYAWTGSTDGSVCVWSMFPNSLAPPDVAALREQFPTMRTLSRDEREAAAHDQGVDVVLPRSLGHSTSIPISIIAARSAAASAAAAVANAAANAASITISAPMPPPPSVSPAPVAPGTPVMSRRESSDPAGSAVSSGGGGGGGADEPLSSRRESSLLALPKPSGAAPRPSAPAPAPDEDEASRKKKQSGRRKSLAPASLGEFSAAVEEALNASGGSTPPAPPLPASDGTTAPPGSPLPPRFKPAPPPPLDDSAAAAAAAAGADVPSLSSLGSNVMTLGDDDEYEVAGEDKARSSLKKIKHLSGAANEQASPRKLGGSGVRPKSKSSSARREIEIDMDADDVPDVLKKLAAAQRGEGDAATLALVQNMSQTGSMPALRRSPPRSVAPTPPLPSVDEDASGAGGSKLAKKLAKSTKSRKSYGAAEMTELLSHSTGIAKSKPPPPPLPEEEPAMDENRSKPSAPPPPAVPTSAPPAAALAVPASVGAAAQVASLQAAAAAKAAKLLEDDEMD